MSKEYRKKCSRCGKEIIMRLMESGKWGAFETDDTAHKCMTLTGTSDKPINRPEIPQAQTPQNGKVMMTATATAAPSSSSTPSSLVSRTQDETRMLKDFVATHTWPVNFSDEEIKMIREIVQVF